MGRNVEKVDGQERRMLGYSDRVFCGIFGGKRERYERQSIKLYSDPIGTKT